MDWAAVRQALLGSITESVLPPSIKLPVLPKAVMEFSQKADDPNVSHQELARIIETDAGLTAELLRHINSAGSGLRGKVTQLKQVLGLIGVRSTRMFILSAGVERAFPPSRSKLMHFGNFSASNVERALFARQVARFLKVPADLAYASSLLCDLLLPVLTNEIVDTYIKFTNEPEATRPPLAAWERKQFGWDHALAIGQILNRWSLPDEIVCAVLLHHGGLQVVNHPALGKTAVAAVAAAALIPDALRQSGDSMPQLKSLETVWPGFDLMATARQIDTEFKAAAPQLSNPFPLVRKLERMAAPTH